MTGAPNRPQSSGAGTDKYSLGYYPAYAELARRIGPAGRVLEVGFKGLRRGWIVPDICEEVGRPGAEIMDLRTIGGRQVDRLGARYRDGPIHAFTPLKGLADA